MSLPRRVTVTGVLDVELDALLPSVEPDEVAGLAEVVVPRS